MGYTLNGVESDGIPMHIIKPLIDNHDIPFFCETGTAGGHSAMLAASYFKKIWTIELLEDSPQIDNVPDNIEFLIGDSVKILPDIVQELIKLKGSKKRQFVLFYLDAHYCGDVPNESEYPECPVLEEIKEVAKYGEDALVIIDDARLFFGSPPYPHDSTQWPSICEIFHLLRKCFPFHKITITDDYVLAMSIHVMQTIDNEWRSRFSIRYPNAEDKLKSQAQDVYKALIDYLK